MTTGHDVLTVAPITVRAACDRLTTTPSAGSSSAAPTAAARALSAVTSAAGSSGAAVTRRTGTSVQLDGPGQEQRMIGVAARGRGQPQRQAVRHNELSERVEVRFEDGRARTLDCGTDEVG